MTTSSPPASAAIAASHATPAPLPTSGAEAIVRVLADEGVEVIFGYSGGAILPVYDAVFRHNALHPREDGGDSLPLVVPANEQGAGFMAGGYARDTEDTVGIHDATLRIAAGMRREKGRAP